MEDKLLMDSAFLDEVEAFLGDTQLTKFLSLPETLDFEDTLTFDPVSPAFDQLAHETQKTAAPDSLQVSPSFDWSVRLRTKDAKRRRVYRERLKQERDDLRRQVSELTAVLDDLKNSQAISDGKCKHQITQPNPLWRALAIQHKELRRIAEIDQRRLREAVAARAVMIKDFDGFIQQKLTESGVIRDALIRIPSSRTPKRARLDPMLVETFVHQTDLLYARTDEVMRDCGMTSKDYNLNFRPTRKVQGKTAYFEYAWRHITPSDLQRSERALWEAAHMLHRQDDRECYSDESKDTFALKFRIKCSSSSSVSLLEHVVVRRFKEKYRTVMVWRTFTEGEKALSGMHSDKTGWCILRPSETGTIKETYIRQVPTHFGKVATAEDKRAMDQFTIMIHESSEEDGIEIARGLRLRG
ncbi:hypothetical protein PHYBOEH_008210 [Phytophthora boehmeriae]|uniref:M96 mating-specific protein family n=1 Tax=Phytophthora boehmeriae TaxID=109152 RepID=A0A8T1X097_9STRA|nr:hypothetical protein PHYBOEH_008210 [Phytophthora boehmeriae]